jgi:hypothetical protein
VQDSRVGLVAVQPLRVAGLVAAERLLLGKAMPVVARPQMAGVVVAVRVPSDRMAH